MAIKKQKLGPGTLTVGETASGKEFGAGVTKCTIEPSYSDGEKVVVLSGDRDETDGDFEGKLTGEFFQEYTTESLMAWTWKNDGKTLPFTFIPSKDSGLTVKGEVKVRPVNIGGDVDKENTAEFEWALTGLPKITGKTSSS